MFIIYKTTNKINQKFYIGVSNTKRRWYKGSGSVLKKAFKKYGYENFNRETLFEFQTEEEAYQKEAEIVNNDLLLNPLCYNIKLGGKGGKSGLTTVKHSTTNEYIGAVSCEHPLVKNGTWVHILKGKDTYFIARQKALQQRKGKPGPRKGVTLSNETKEKIRLARLGSKQSEATKKKRSIKMKNRKQQILTCPHCGVTGGNTMNRWHFDRCKRKS